MCAYSVSRNCIVHDCKALISTRICSTFYYRSENIVTLYSCVPQVVDKTKNITEIPEWFRGSRLNYAENLLRCKDNKTAIIECGMCLVNIAE